MLNKQELIASEADLRNQANAIRALSMDAVQKANSGHPGMPMGMADVATILFSEFLSFHAKDPHWHNRDRFILSAGHGSMLQYALLYLTGYEEATIDEIKQFRQFGSKTAGHPEYGYLEGVETTTGPLGQGLANAVGMAFAETLLAESFGKEICDHYTYVIAGDGCLMEGISHEAISFAGHMQLDKLIVLFDDNQISIDGPTDLTVSDDQLKRFQASNWHTIAIDGHDFNQIRKAITEAKSSNKPTMIACRTTIAYGSPNKAGTSASHGAPLGDEEISKTKEALGWDHGAFDIPDNILNWWREVGTQNQSAYDRWHDKYNSMETTKKDAYDAAIAGKLPENFSQLCQEIREKFIDEAPKYATRKSSGIVLESLSSHMPQLLGGSADLTGSNLTKTTKLDPISAEDLSGRYVYYGVREHAMAAIMNGIVLHKGFIPYGGTFLVFTDYCRPSIRLSALMKQRIIYVMTHDSIGLGEDGPTHQPVEHVASLRAMPNVLVLRPADAVETAESWEIALEHTTGPSILCLSRQGLPAVRKDHPEINQSRRGFYLLNDHKQKHLVTLFASGSEVEVALETQALLEAKGYGTRVISCVSMELFEQQEESYKDALTADDSLKVAIEAGCRQGWERYIGAKGVFVGMDSFGESAPAEVLYKHFGITADAACERILNILEDR